MDALRAHSAITVSALLAAFTFSSPVQSADNTPPSTPPGLRATSYSQSAGGVAWQRSTDDVAVRGYQIIRDGELFGEFDTLSHVEQDLDPGTSYHYRVSAVDTSGNVSVAAEVTLITRGGYTSDEAPAAPIATSALRYSPTAGEIAWERPATPRLRYEISRDDRRLQTTDGTSHFDDTLEPGREYRYAVVTLSPSGERSSSTRFIVPATRDNGSSTPALAAPVALGGQRYSATAGEVFWERAGTVGLSYEVSRDGNVVQTTNGISYFDDTLAAERTYAFDIVAMQGDGTRSAPTRIQVAAFMAGTVDPDGPPPSTPFPPPASPDGGLRFGNVPVDDILRGSFLLVSTEKLVEGASLVEGVTRELRGVGLDAALFGGSGSGAGVTVVSIEENPSDDRFDVFRRFGLACDAGGSAVVDYVSGPASEPPNVARYEQCSLVSSTYDGAFQSLVRDREGSTSLSFGIDQNAASGIDGVRITRGRDQESYGGSRSVDYYRGQSGSVLAWSNGRYESSLLDAGGAVESIRLVVRDLEMQVEQFEDQFSGISYVRRLDGTVASLYLPGKKLSLTVGFEVQAAWTSEDLFSVSIDLEDSTGVYAWFDDDPGYPVTDLGARIPTSTDSAVAPEQNTGGFIEPEPVGSARQPRGEIIITASDGRGRLLVQSGEGDAGTFTVTVENTGDSAVRRWADFPSLCPLPLDCY